MEIAAGAMLGSGYEERAFYVRKGTGTWRKTYIGKVFQPEAVRRVMNREILN